MKDHCAEKRKVETGKTLGPRALSIPETVQTMHRPGRKGQQEQVAQRRRRHYEKHRKN